MAVIDAQWPSPPLHITTGGTQAALLRMHFVILFWRDSIGAFKPSSCAGIFKVIKLVAKFHFFWISEAVEACMLSSSCQTFRAFLFPPSAREVFLVGFIFKRAHMAVLTFDAGTLSTSFPKLSHPSRLLLANISRYGPGTSRSMRSYTHSGFRECCRLGSTIL